MCRKNQRNETKTRRSRKSLASKRTRIDPNFFRLPKRKSLNGTKNNFLGKNFERFRRK